MLASGRGIIRLDQLGDPAQAKPAESAPVLRPAIDQQRDLRPRDDVTNALEIVGIGNPLWLFVEW